jgi:hypothetical protein
MTETPFRAEPGEASYATLAHVINAACSPDPPIGRQQVYEWAERGTLNARGQEFPQPVRSIPEGERRRGQPSFFYSTQAVLEWYEDGY